MPRRLVSLLASLVASLALRAAPAQAAQFDISPVLLSLTGAAPSSTIAVTNRSPEQVRLHVTAFRWSQSDTGAMNLEPTRDVVFFPAMLVLNQGESRQIRVGTKLKPGATERSYRIFVQELPPLARTAEERAANVRMLTKLGIPVFIEAVNPKPNPQLTAPSVQGRSVSFAVRNAGSAHVIVQKVMVVAKAGGKVVYTTDQAGWYVLAGESRRYVVELPPQACKAGTSLEVSVQSEAGSPKALLPQFSCGPS